MIKFEYLSRGLNALARAHKLSSMAGHLGASVIAGYFVGEQHPDLDDKVLKGVEGDLERVIRGESVFGARMKKGAGINDTDLFAPFPKQKPDERLIDGIAEELGQSITKPRQSGHNVIFASIAIRALTDHPDLATPALVDGIIKLMRQFRNAHPGSGNYGKAKGRIHGHKIKLPESEESPYDNLSAMASTVLDEIIHQDPKVHRQGYGGLVHVCNHAAALVELSRYGYDELVAQGLKAHHHHLRLYRNLPNLADELGPVVVSKHLPFRPAYWTDDVPYDRALLTHRVKTMYGFDELAEVVEDMEKRKQAYDKLRYLM